MSRRQALWLLGGAGSLCAFGGDVAAESAVKSRAIIRTVLEDISPERLQGTTLFHEHLSMTSRSGAPIFYDDVGLIADEVKASAADGVACIVDAGVAALGRKIDALRAIAKRSGVFIVAGGGLHVKSDYSPDIFRKTADQIADDFVALASAERWGIIGEMGTGTAVPVDAVERKAFQAAAHAHIRTGLSILTHTSDGCARCAIEQVDILEAAGANLTQVVIGHLNDIEDQLTSAALAIAKRGANLGFDHSGRPDDPRADEYVRTILAVLDAGFVDRVYLSSDFANAKYLRKNGGPGIDMTVTTMVPRLRRAGVSDETLRRILIENPRRLLTFEPRE